MASGFNWTSAASNSHHFISYTLTSFSYTRSGRSNMAVAEVNTLSGYKFDGEEMQKLTGIPDLQRVELDNDDTKMNLYFNPVPNKLF